MEITYDVYGSMRGDMHAMRWSVLDVSHGWGNRDGVLHGTGVDDLRVIGMCMRFFSKLLKRAYPPSPRQPLGKWVGEQPVLRPERGLELRRQFCKKKKPKKSIRGWCGIPGIQDLTPSGI